jgi:hypothetical protein
LGLDEGLEAPSSPDLAPEAKVPDYTQDPSSTSPVLMDVFQSSSVPVRSDVSRGCLSPTSQPLAYVSALLVDNPPIPVSMASTMNVVHQEPTASVSHIDWNCGMHDDGGRRLPVGE